MNWIAKSKSFNSQSAINLFVIACVCLVSNVLAAAEDEAPPFLAGAPKEIVKDFNDLFNEGKTDPEIDKAVEGWIGQQSPEIKVGIREEFSESEVNDKRDVYKVVCIFVFNLLMLIFLAGLKNGINK